MSLIAAATIAFGALLPSAFAADPTPPEAAAVLYGIKGEVKVRKANELGWDSGKNGRFLYDHDAVKTGETSIATIEFEDESHLNVNEKSIVIVLQPAKSIDMKKAAVALPEGTVEAAVTEEKRRPMELVVRTARGWIHADNKKGGKTRFRVAETHDNLKIQTLAGEVKIAAKGKERTIRAGESLTLTGPIKKGSEDYYNELPVSTSREFDVPPKPKKSPSPRPKPAAKPSESPKPSPSPSHSTTPTPTPKPTPSASATPIPAVDPEEPGLRIIPRPPRPVYSVPAPSASPLPPPKIISEP